MIVENLPKALVACGVGLMGLVTCAHAADLQVESGGVVLDWRKPAADDARLPLISEGVRNRIVVATVPGTGPLPSFEGGSAQRVKPQAIQLYDNGVRLPIASWPRKGHAMVAETAATYDEHHPEKRPKTVAFKTGAPGPLISAWAKEPDLWVWGAWKFGWDDAVVPVVKTDTAVGSLVIGTESVTYGIVKGYDGGGWYQVRNAFSALERPGDWVADRKSRRIYLVKPEGGTSGLTAAIRENILKLEAVSDRIIEGKVFECCWGDAVILRNCTNVVIRRSVVRNTGGWGVRIEGGRNCRVEGCDLYDLGEGGVNADGGDWRKLEPGGHAVVNCHIHHYGRVIHNYRPGVRLGGVSNRAEHNLIHDARHAGIVFMGNDQYVGWNIIHDVCQDNYDCGALYTYTSDCWWARGSVVEYNLIHMVGRKKHSSCTPAFYIDGFASGVTVRHNIASRATDGFFQNGGNDNEFSCNISVGCSTALLRNNLGLMGGATPYVGGPGVGRGRDSDLFKELDRKRALFETPAWKGRYPNMLRVYEVEDPVKAHNSFFSVITNNVWAWGRDPTYVDRDQMGDWQTIANNVALDDPGFVDYDGLNFELKPDSPARKVLGGGTRFSEMGLFESPHRVSPAVKFGPHPTPTWRRFDWAAPMAMIRVIFPEKPPKGTDYLQDKGDLYDMKFAYPLGNVWRKNFGTLFEREGWRKCTCTFTPGYDTTCSFLIEGWHGEKTVFDDFEVSGCSIANLGFEDDGGWKMPKADVANVKKGCNAGEPFGMLGVEAGVTPRSGRRAYLGNAYLPAVQDGVAVRKGVPVTITFWVKSFGN